MADRLALDHFVVIEQKGDTWARRRGGLVQATRRARPDARHREGFSGRATGRLGNQAVLAFWRA
jgi:hypothetical protein